MVDKIDSVEPQVLGIQEKSNNTIGDNLTANTSVNISFLLYNFIVETKSKI